MDENRNTSITFFILMGVAFVIIVIYAFVIHPRKNANTRGSSDLVLDSPIQKWNMRYAENGVIPFCEDGNEWLSIEVEDGTNVYAGSDGIVLGTEDNIVTIEADTSIHIEYSSIGSPLVSREDYVYRGDSIGRVDGIYLNLRVKDIRRGLYVCPYSYLNTFAKDILDSVEEVIGEEVDMCECNTLDY